MEIYIEEVLRKKTLIAIRQVSMFISIASPCCPLPRLRRGKPIHADCNAILYAKLLNLMLIKRTNFFECYGIFVQVH